MSTAPAEAATQRQIRRPSAVVRGLLLDSARQLFAAKGYAGASTREIAEQAGVREALIFRHFGNKAGLFHAAVVEPFRELIDDFVDSWEATYVSNSMSTPDLTAAWIHNLHRLMRDHRDLIVALISADSPDNDQSFDGPPLSDAFTAPLKRMEAFTRREMTGRGLSANPAVGVRATFGMVMSMAVLEDWFFSGLRSRPSEATIAREMTNLVVYGLAGQTVVSSGRQD